MLASIADVLLVIAHDDASGRETQNLAGVLAHLVRVDVERADKLQALAGVDNLERRLTHAAKTPDDDAILVLHDVPPLACIRYQIKQYHILVFVAM